MELHSKSTIKYECDLCGKELATKQTYKRHLDTHSKRYECDVCGERLSSGRSLKNHMNVRHTQDEIYKCDVCDKEFFSEPARRTHILGHDRKSIKCEFCAREFANQNRVREHVLSCHTGTKETMSCDICKKTFRCHMKSLRQHMLKHIGEMAKVNGSA